MNDPSKPKFPQHGSPTKAEDASRSLIAAVSLLGASLSVTIATPTDAATVNVNTHIQTPKPIIHTPATHQFRTNQLRTNQLKSKPAIMMDQEKGSDVRLKRDIVLVGRLDDGLGLYRYRYLWSDQVYVGVMAQEVALIHPDAVVRGFDGYLRVYYSRLGLKMMTWSEWDALSKGDCSFSSLMAALAPKAFAIAAA
jgi:hypothetical protein